MNFCGSTGQHNCLPEKGCLPSVRFNEIKMDAGRQGQNNGRKSCSGPKIDGLGDMGRHVRDELKGIIDVTCPEMIDVLAAYEPDA
jgi:hypothetical protein